MHDDKGIERAKYSRLVNEFNAMQLELDEYKKLAEDRKNSVDRLSAELSKIKRKKIISNKKEKRNESQN